MVTGRFAPSPSGPLHIGNLRTALLALCFARSAGGDFLIRMEDLTTEASADHESAQLADLAALGIDHDGDVVRQSERRDLYAAAITRLEDADLTYPCFCSRREITEAVIAPHGELPEGAYPGTCSHLSSSEQQRRMAQRGRSTLRIRAAGRTVSFEDQLCGAQSGRLDDFVLRRWDGIAAYNLAVVVDDHDQGIDQVTRGDDLLATTPRQIFVHQVLGFEPPTYVHVPLVLGPDGRRIAKRHGPRSLAEMGAAGLAPLEVLRLLAESIGITDLAEPLSANSLAGRFDPGELSRSPWTFDLSAEVTS